MVRRNRDVRAHEGHRVGVTRAVLDAQALAAVGIIARPALRRIVEHARVKTAAARGAGLEQDVREFARQPLVEAVDAEDVTVENLALMLRTPARRAALRDTAVHVPLDVVDLSRAQDLVDGVVNIVDDFRTREV